MRSRHTGCSCLVPTAYCLLDCLRGRRPPTMIRPDSWIKKMALQQKLIEPFVAEQVRSVDGKPVVSYGLSSFGYDVRVADEFRIFTNVYNSIVDPKAFDSRGLVEFKSPICD